MSHPKKQSLTQKYLLADCWSLFSKKTSFGTNIYDCVKSAVENPSSNVGLYAPGIIVKIFIGKTLGERQPLKTEIP